MSDIGLWKDRVFSFNLNLWDLKAALSDHYGQRAIGIANRGCLPNGTFLLKKQSAEGKVMEYVKL